MTEPVAMPALGAVPDLDACAVKLGADSRDTLRDDHHR